MLLVAVQPPELVAVTVYVVVLLGFAVTVESTVEDKPVEGDHK